MISDDEMTRIENDVKYQAITEGAKSNTCEGCDFNHPTKPWTRGCTLEYEERKCVSLGRKDRQFIMWKKV